MSIVLGIMPSFATIVVQERDHVLTALGDCSKPAENFEDWH